MNQHETNRSIITELEEHARCLRKDVITMVYKAGDGHIGTSLSVCEIVTALYFKIMNVRPTEPDWDSRDRLILSKGHACPMVYAALARRGFFPTRELETLRKINSRLQGHPDTEKTPGIDATAGPLGTGISIGCGMAIAARLKNQESHTYVICGDGELNEGLNWEGVMTAHKYNLGGLIVFIDNNGYQSGGTVRDVSAIEPILPKLESFGWHCQEIDGHSFEEILTAVDIAGSHKDKPSAILSHTIKARGVDFMEGTNDWHKRVPTDEEFEQAITYLEGVPR